VSYRSTTTSDVYLVQIWNTHGVVPGPWHSIQPQARVFTFSVYGKRVAASGRWMVHAAETSSRWPKGQSKATGVLPTRISEALESQIGIPISGMTWSKIQFGEE